MFKTRLLSGIVLVILAILFIVLGGDVLLAVTAIISLIGMFELYRVFKIEKSILAFVGYIAAIIFYLNLRLNFIDDFLILAMAFMIILMFVYVLAYPKFDALKILAVFFGLFYVGVMLSYVYQIRMIEKGGLYLAFLVFICSWGADTCAYCVGMLCNKTIGTHKMAPVLSPKKSIEGAVGGVVGAGLLGALYLSIFKVQIGLDTSGVWIIALICAVAGFISMFGDLTASAIKRNYDIKDYGKLIPGHGGILDRFDSMIITAPIIYYLIVFAGNFIK